MMKSDSNKRILYLSYDGLTDPLGQSQILPYLIGLSQRGYSFTIISFEKKYRFLHNKANIESTISRFDIKWVPLSFSVKPPLLSKFYDVVRLRKKAFQLFRKEKFDMVHCRSYIAADIGMQMKQKFGVKFFFDMRGFWADEKRDGGAWGSNHPVFSMVYAYYKKKEAWYLKNADYIILLTEAGRNEIMKWDSYTPSIPLKVIPCCTDMNHFSLAEPEQKRQSRKKLNINEERFVVSYLGSIGSWYMTTEMFQFFSEIKKKYPKAFFLFITHSEKKSVQQIANENGIHKDDILIIEASRNEVPLFLKASDINLSFIKPVYSKISSSPTKLGEVLAMGIPVIANANVGDVEFIINQTEGGFVLKDLSIKSIEEAIKEIPRLLKLDPITIRKKAHQIFDLEKGILLYADAYNKLLNTSLN